MPQSVHPVSDIMRHLVRHRHLQTVLVIARKNMRVITDYRASLRNPIHTGSPASQIKLHWNRLVCQIE